MGSRDSGSGDYNAAAAAAAAATYYTNSDVLNEETMVGEHFIKVLFHELQHLTVCLGDDRSFAVDVEQDGERAEMVATTHLTRHAPTVRTQPL